MKGIDDTYEMKLYEANIDSKNSVKIHRGISFHLKPA